MSFIAHGIVLLCILPPFEGWDEYQHVAYIQYMTEQGQTPTYGPSKVSKDLLKKLVAFPQPELMVKQTNSTGAKEYATFYKDKSAPQYNKDHPDILLYV
ncbi:hypothetical protein [Candidatus Magnetomonas plexicatena]|uniref:hypothetical protein n=1 Tax=Candidatus Magnetomonas plexicatena TaxID=2552947 RepID=UPI001C7649F8|nr:hypothetical protein E2O03_009035 [Nitrospirales bacterium LBB_01]